MEEVEELGDGRMRVTMMISERPWLERLLLRLGRGATMVEGDATITPACASKVLARYTDSVGRS
jgi:hypothetical protein